MDQKEVRFPCPACQVLVSIDTTLCGMQARCPNCDEVILIPYNSPLEFSGDWSEDNLKDALSIAVRPYREKLLDHQGRLKKVTEDFNSQFERMREVESASLRLQRELWLFELEREELVAEGKLSKKTKRKKEALKELNKAGLSEETLEALARDLLQLQRAHSRLQDDHTLYLQKHLPEIREFEVQQEQLEKAQAEAKELRKQSKGAKQAEAASSQLEKELEKQTQAHEKTIHALQGKHDQLEKQQLELTQTLDQKEQLLKDSEAVLNDLKAQDEEQKKQQLADETSTNEKLQKALEGLEKNTSTHHALEDELTQQNKRLAESQAESEKLSKALELREQEQANESKDITALKEELEVQQLNTNTQAKEKETLANEVARLEDAATQAQSVQAESVLKMESLEAAAKGFEVQITSLCELQDKLEGEIKNSNLRLQKKQDQHRELQELHERVVSSEQGLQAQLNSLQASLDTAESDNEQNVQLKTDLEAALITNRELQVKIGEQEADFIVLDTALHQAEIDVNQFKETLSENEKEEHSTTASVKELEAQFLTLQSVMDRIEDYEQQKSSSSESHHKAEEDFREKLEVSRIKQAESEIELEKKEADLEKANVTIAALESKVTQVTEEKKVFITEAENAQALSEKLNQMEFHSEESSKRNESYTKLIEDLESENGEIKGRLKELTSTKEKLEKEVAKNKKGAPQSETGSPGEVTILEMQTEAREAAVLRSRVTRLEIELRNTTKENEQLQNSINTLRENLRVAMGTDRGIKR